MPTVIGNAKLINSKLIVNTDTLKALLPLIFEDEDSVTIVAKEGSQLTKVTMGRLDFGTCKTTTDNKSGSLGFTEYFHFLRMWCIWNIMSLILTSRDFGQPKGKDVISMLLIIAAVLIALWLLGIITSFTIGGFIHILLVIAIIVVLVRIIRGKRVI